MALISQSGNVAVNALGTRRGLRFHTVVASGNQAVLSAADYLELLAGEDGLGSVALYLEDDGGPRSVSGAGRLCGRRRRGSWCSRSGALPAGRARCRRAQRRACGRPADLPQPDRGSRRGLGARRARTSRAGQDAGSPAHRPGDGGGLAIVTCSGGDSAQGADAAAEAGLGLPRFSRPDRREAERAAAVGGDGRQPARLHRDDLGRRRALGELVSTVGADPAIGQVLVFYDQPPRAGRSRGRVLGRGARGDHRRGGAPARRRRWSASTLPELLDDAAAWRFAQAGVPRPPGCAPGSLRGGDAAAGGRLRAATRDRGGCRAASLADPRTRGRSWLSEHESKELLRAGGIERRRRADRGRDAADAVAALARARRADRAEAELRRGAAQVRARRGRARPRRPRPTVRDAYRAARGARGRVTAARCWPSGWRRPGVELLVAARTDAIVPALVLGLGGIWTELLGRRGDRPAARRRRPDRAGAALAARCAGARSAAAAACRATWRAAARLAQRVGELLLDRVAGADRAQPGAVSVRRRRGRRGDRSRPPLDAVARASRNGRACTT